VSKQQLSQHFSADRPIDLEEQDEFQRADFAKRIVRLIEHRGKADCLVIGVYGTWGEGKTSVIRMIDSMLVSSEIATTYRFNPWTFKEEGALLREFFFGLSRALDKKLLTGWDEFAKHLKRYSGLLSIGLPGVKGVEATVEGLGDMIGDVGNEELKKRLGECLEKYERPIVIFLDDIDRLSKDEVHAVFRLVKLTGDLPNVTYVLCFDDEMVAAAIGERFGQGDVHAGRDFLEKVIQVPLRLPRIPVRGESGLQMYALGQIQNVLNSCGVELSEGQAHDLHQRFDEAILPKLLTPREALRYSNALSFTIPMLSGEVNVVDLMLFEALRIFYPEYHKFVSEERDMFIGSFDKPFAKERNTVKIDRFTSKLKELAGPLTPDQKKGVEGLIEYLFPRTEEATGNSQFSMTSWKRWLRDQRIASPEYFQRYLTYSVIKGQLHDTQLAVHLEAIGRGVPGAADKAVPHLVENSSHREFLRKLMGQLDNVSPTAAGLMAVAIARNSSLFPKERSFMNLGFDSPQSLASDGIAQLLKKMPEAEQITTLLQSVESASSFEFALAVVWEVGDEVQGKRLPEPLLNRAQAKLRARAIKEASGEPIFRVFPKYTRHLLYAWEKEDATAVIEYLNGALRRSPDAGMALLRGLTPDIRSSSQPEPFLVDFGEEDYQKCVRCCDADLLTSKLREEFSEIELNSDAVRWTDREPTQTDLNIVRQFLHWHERAEGLGGDSVSDSSGTPQRGTSEEYSGKRDPAAFEPGHAP